jgi:hypothetical protein
MAIGFSSHDTEAAGVAKSGGRKENDNCSQDRFHVLGGEEIDNGA